MNDSSPTTAAVETAEARADHGVVGHGDVGHGDVGHGDVGHGVDEHGTGDTALFLKVFAALCVLTGLSFGIANSPLMESKLLGWASMMAVSCAKAFLVISFFMHLRWERSWKYVLTIPASIMAILLVLSLVPDIGLRAQAYSQMRWLHASESEPAGTTESSATEAAGEQGLDDGPPSGDTTSGNTTPTDVEGETP